jgi:hypothetical protein
MLSEGLGTIKRDSLGDHAHWTKKKKNSPELSQPRYYEFFYDPWIDASFSWSSFEEHEGITILEDWGSCEMGMQVTKPVYYLISCKNWAPFIKET